MSAHADPEPRYGRRAVVHRPTPETEEPLTDLVVHLPADAQRGPMRDLLGAFGVEMSAAEMDRTVEVETTVTCHSCTPAGLARLREGFSDLFPGTTYEERPGTPWAGEQGGRS